MFTSASTFPVGWIHFFHQILTWLHIGRAAMQGFVPPGFSVFGKYMVPRVDSWGVNQMTHTTYWVCKFINHKMYMLTVNSCFHNNNKKKLANKCNKIQVN